MVLHVWLIPLTAIGAGVLWILYVIVKHTGGPGVRTQGRTVVHKDVDEQDPPPMG